MKKIKILFLFLIFLQITDGYKLVLLVLGQRTKVASVLTLLLCLAYVFFNLRVFFRLYRNRLFKHWLRVITFLPIAFHTYHLVLGNLDVGDYIYWISLNILFGSLFSVCCMISYSEKRNFKINTLFIASILFTIIGLIVSVINYPLILQLEILTGDDRYDPDRFIGEVNRAVGFYGQPNLAAKALITFLIILIGTGLSKVKNLYKGILIFVILLSVFWTGSRTAIIISVLFLLLYNPFLNLGDNIKRYKGKMKILYQVFGIFKVVFPLLGFLLILPIFLSRINTGLAEKISERFDFLSNIFSNDDIRTQDGSVRMRLDTVENYINYILEKPILGHGITKREDFIQSGIFEVGAQNEFLEFGFAFGILFILYLTYVIFKTYILATKYSSRSHIIFSLQIFIFSLFVYCFSLNYLFIDRVTIISFGLLLGGSFRDLETSFEKIN